MKLSAILLFVFAGLTLATESYSQSTFLDINAKNKTVQDVLDEIEKQSEYHFFYNNKQVNTSRIVTVKSSKKTVFNILDQLFSETDISYKVLEKSIILSQKETLHKAGTAQQNIRKISGIVKDATGMTIIGANVVEKGSTNGTVTDTDGRFELSIPSNATLTISYIGYLSQNITIGNRSIFNITLVEDSKTLGEVIVTAFGIKRDEKALGYAVQKVRGEELATVKTVDIATSLTGKVAGMNVKNSTEFNTAPTVLVRGEEPLIVVDGVPYSNISLRDIVSDDIESIDVLKGATASALYGARGGSGVIMITTKKGSMEEGLDISVNSSTMFNAGYLAIPDAQSSYSSGTGGKYDSYDYVWGDKLDIGHTAVQYNPNTYEWEEQPLVSKGKNNFRNFLEQGLSTNNNISVAWKGENGGFRTSLNHVYSKGQYPNEKLQKLTYSITGNAKYGNLTIEGGAIWNKRFYSNDRGSGYGGGGYIYNLIVWTGTDYDVRDYRNYWVQGKEHQKQKN